MLYFVIRWSSKAQCAKLNSPYLPIFHASKQSNKTRTTFVYNIILNGNILICLTIQHWALGTEHVCRLFFYVCKGAANRIFHFTLLIFVVSRCRCCCSRRTRRCRCCCYCSEHYSNEVVNFTSDKVTSLKWRSSTLTGYYCC